MKKRGNPREKTILKSKNGQVWVETVVYLLIAFVMMGLVLSFIKPKIEEMRDKTTIEQSLEVLKQIDNSITTIGSPGNKRLIEVGVRKGSLNINSGTNVVTFEIESVYAYSEAGETIQYGNVQLITEKEGQRYKITIKRDFNQEYDLTYNSQPITKSLTKSPIPYNLYIETKENYLAK